MSGDNCSFCEDCNSLSDIQTKSLLEGMFLKLCEYLLIFSVVIVLYLIDIVISSECKLKKPQLSDMKLIFKKIIHIISLSLLILTLPFVAIFITGALMYKVLCSVAIKRKDRRFVKFLDSFDVFYCLEDKNTTDIQGTIQCNTIEIAVDSIKEKLKNIFTNSRTDKIFYRRNEEYGFYYWRRYSYIDLAQYIQIEEVPATIDKDIHHISKIKHDKSDQIVTNDEGLFKVVIAKNHGDKLKDEHKITLKFHNSIKDATLIEFVTRLVEKSDDCRVALQSIPEFQDRDSPDVIINMITKLCDILARSLENNDFNGKTQYNTINRLKTLEWSKSDENLLCKLKNVCDLNLTVVMVDTLATILNKLER